MNFTDLVDDPEDAQHSLAERAAAASRSTWVSVAVNIVLTGTQIVVGVLAKSQGLIADGTHSLSDLVAGDHTTLRRVMVAGLGVAPNRTNATRR